jgi:pyruvate,water dikinase
MADVTWNSPAPGAYTRMLRFGEWIFEPVTPLFESWLLSTMEERLHAILLRFVGQRAPKPHHVIVNGWYFYSLNWISPRSMLRSLPGIIWHAIRDPRRTAGVIPPTVRHSIPVFERDWREDLRPRYLAAVAAARARVETAPVAELPALIDELADLAGESFTSIAALSGAAYKVEINLARFYRKHLAPRIGGNHMTLLAGLDIPAGVGGHAVTSMDWWFEPAPAAAGAAPSTGARSRLVAAREAAEAAARTALAASPGRLRAFERLLADAQHTARIREEQVGELTIAWPVMRRAVVRIGESLAEAGAISEPDDVFFLTRDELLAALRGDVAVGGPLGDVAAERRRIRVEQAHLVPPQIVGRANRFLRGFTGTMARMVGAVPSEHALAMGAPTSPGRATGRVRVIRNPSEFGELQEGEVLVAPITAPAWTPLFTLASAVVTDVGSVMAHASVIAREYGIPAVVGCGDATSRLRTGMLVTVDGSTGNVEPA